MQRKCCEWSFPLFIIIIISAIRCLEDRQPSDHGHFLGVSSLKAGPAIGTAALIALGDNHPRHAMQYAALGSAAGFYDDYQDGRDPAGITTQNPELAARLDPVEGGRRVANYLRVLTMEAQTLARACGKAHLRNLEPEDLVALTVEAAAMARVPLAGTSWIPGSGL